MQASPRGFEKVWRTRQRNLVLAQQINMLYLLGNGTLCKISQDSDIARDDSMIYFSIPEVHIGSKMQFFASLNSNHPNISIELNVEG